MQTWLERMMARMTWSGTATEGSGGGTATAEPSGQTASPGGAPPSTDPGPSQGNQGSGDGGDVSADLKRILDYDPFAPGVTNPGEARRGPEPGQSPSPAAAPGAPQAPAANPPTEQRQQENSESQLAAAARALAETTRQLPETMREAARPPAPKEDPWAPKDEHGNPFNYAQVQIPDELVAAMGSDNPLERKMALSQMAAGLGHLIHRQAVQHVMTQMRAEFAQVLPNYVSEQLRSYNQQQEVFNDFYGKYPMLSNPAIRPVVMQEAQRLAQQMRVEGWTPEFRDALGQRVLQVLRGAVPAQQAPAPAPAAAMSGMAVRPEGIGQPQQAKPWDDLFFGS